MIERRSFISLAGAAAAWPIAARAQQAAMPVVGYLSGNSQAEWTRFVAAFHAGLKELGYVEGQNVAFEYRWAEGQYNRLPALASDLVRKQVAVIAAAGGTESALAAQTATSAIPIVVLVGRDPVEALGSSESPFEIVTLIECRNRERGTWKGLPPPRVR